MAVISENGVSSSGYETFEQSEHNPTLVANAENPELCAVSYYFIPDDHERL
jgi:hypothetical protein